VTGSQPVVLVVTPRYLPERGGVESHVQQVVRRLQTDFHVRILTTDNGVGLPGEETMDGVPVSRVRARPRGRDWRFAPAVFRRVTDADVDLVHCQGVHTFVPVLAMAAARRTRTPYLVSFHTGGHSSRARSRIRGVQWRLLRPLLAGASRLVCVADFERTHFARVLGLPLDRFVVIPNGGELPPPPEVAGGRTVAHRVISVGRLERYKGHHRLVQAMPEVIREVPDAELVIVGSGPYEAALREEIRRRGLEGVVTITSVPAADRAAMAELVASAAVFALLSDYEAHPLAVMEAVVMGKPAVVSDTSGLAEIAARGLAQAVPQGAGATAVAAALIGQLRDPQPPPGVVAVPTWDDAAAALGEVYRAAVVPRS
jgi:glycosyltransferase involved in cell wall biosynthesis